jgi:hypothetical protein
LRAGGSGRSHPPKLGAEAGALALELLLARAVLGIGKPRREPTLSLLWDMSRW